MKSVGFGSGNRHKNDINATNACKSLGIRYHFAGQSRGGAARAASAIARRNGTSVFFGTGSPFAAEPDLGQVFVSSLPYTIPLTIPLLVRIPLPSCDSRGLCLSVCEAKRSRSRSRRRRNRSRPWAGIDPGLGHIRVFGLSLVHCCASGINQKLHEHR